MRHAQQAAPEAPTALSVELVSAERHVPSSASQQQRAPGRPVGRHQGRAGLGAAAAAHAAVPAHLPALLAGLRAPGAAGASAACAQAACMHAAQAMAVFIDRRLMFAACAGAELMEGYRADPARPLLPILVQILVGSPGYSHWTIGNAEARG